MGLVKSFRGNEYRRQITLIMIFLLRSFFLSFLTLIPFFTNFQKFQFSITPQRGGWGKKNQNLYFSKIFVLDIEEKSRSFETTGCPREPFPLCFWITVFYIFTLWSYHTIHLKTDKKRNEMITQSLLTEH